MGKIFGISDNPVSTIESALRGQYTIEPPVFYEIKNPKEISVDKFESSANKVSKSKNNASKIVRKMLSYFKK
ncbi:hypothetical protein J6R97_06280 [bacterium]|nr:hypothetical protein [bacterium]